MIFFLITFLAISMEIWSLLILIVKLLSSFCNKLSDNCFKKCKQSIIFKNKNSQNKLLTKFCHKNFVNLSFILFYFFFFFYFFFIFFFFFFSSGPSKHLVHYQMIIVLSLIQIHMVRKIQSGGNLDDYKSPRLYIVINEALNYNVQRTFA